MSLKHDDIWRAVDRLADTYGYSVSGLARAAGLDPTTFNKSKRISIEGKLRWPSTESIAKTLEATGSTMAEFVTFLDLGIGGGYIQQVPVAPLLDASEAGLFNDNGYPHVEENIWEQVDFPDVPDRKAYALEIPDDRFSPVYRESALVLASPQASIRRNDRIVLKLQSGPVDIYQLVRQTAHRIDVCPPNAPDDITTLMTQDISWISRIVWASQ